MEWMAVVGLGIGAGAIVVAILMVIKDAPKSTEDTKRNIDKARVKEKGN